MITLDSITHGAVIEPPRIVIYGIGGIGKTTFGCSAPGAILASTEKGIGRLTVPKFPMLRSWDDVQQMIGVLYQGGHPYTSLCFDSLDWLEPLIWAATCAEHGKANIEDFGYGKGYTYAEKYWKMFFAGMNALQEQGMTVVLTAHTEVKRFDSPETEPYDRYQVKLHKRASELTVEWADIVFFANWEASVLKSDVGFKKQVARGRGTGKRILYAEERPAFKAKNRYGLPARMDLTDPFPWADFLAYINNASAPIAEADDNNQQEGNDNES